MLKHQPPNWHNVVAVFGGTFDPPHRGHEQAILGLFQNPGLKRVLVLPSASPPLKTSYFTASERLKMAELAFHDLPDTEVETLELERSALQPHQPSYTFNTLSLLNKRISNLAFVMGTDQIVDFQRWHRFPEILNLCHWIILDRKPENLAATQQIQAWVQAGILAFHRGDHQLLSISGSEHWLLRVPTPAPALSSTDVRVEFQKTGQTSKDWLHPDVARYLNALKGTKNYGN